MQKGRRPLVVLMAVLIMALASCASTPVNNKTEVVEVTDTTTTTVAPVPGTPGTDGSTTTTTVADTTPPPTGPVVSEIVLRNLFGTANALRSENLSFEIDRVLPDSYRTADAEFQKIKAEYDKAMDAVTFNGEEAFKLKAPFEASITQWEALLAEGLPLRTQEESDKADEARFAAMTAQAADLASERYEGATEYLAEADALADSGNHQMAIPAYRQATAAFEVAVEKSRANSLREKISANGYAQYAESNFQMGEQKYAAEEEYWASGSTSDLKAGVVALREANGYYEFAISSGAQYKSFEGKDQALESRQKALSVKAELNAAEEFASADDILAEALANQEAGNYESSYLWFVDASAAFDAAHHISASLKSENGEAMARAEAATAAARQKSDEAGIAKNVYLDEADYQLARARIQSDNMLFADSTASANEAVNYAALSNSYVDSELKRIAEEEAKAARIAQDAADISMADARTRMAWAENNELSKDYPSEAKEAKAAMEGADIAYENGRYAPAKVLAEEVSSILSDSFQQQVLAERRLAQEKRIEAEEAARAKAAAKATAETAIADAEKRMAWANENGIKADYPDEYAQSSSAMISAYVSYGNESYSAASVKANEVSFLLSDEFQKSVLDARKAAAEKAAAKTAADPAMDDARTRMTWAENNELAKDNPAEAKEAKAAMQGADIAYANERYEPAKTLAEEVSSILSDDFQKSVLDARKAAAEKAAAKAAADPAMDDARTRMAWAENNEISRDYPGQAKESKAAMQGADIAYANERYEPAKTLAEEVSSILSDDFQNSVLDARKAAAEKAAAKTAADPAMDDARTRMAWAENNEISKDYPAETKEAKAAMDGADIAYANERYEPAKTLAEEVSSILSDDFQKSVLDARKAAADKAAADKAAADKAAADKAAADKAAADKAAADKAAADKAAADKAAADKAAADKAAADKAAADKAAADKAAADKAAADKAAADKAAADKAAADKAAADKAAADKAAALLAEAKTAIADAEKRMAWANESNLKSDYAEEYSKASSSMIAAYVSFGNENYPVSTDKAKEVSSILSDDFQAKVEAERKDAADKEAQKAAAKAAADPAIDDARTRMAWAENNDLSKDYPAEAKEAKAAMEGSNIAYANERYEPAKTLAEEVSSILSDDFQKSVLDGRKEVAEKAAAKAVADPAMDDARARMKWAIENNIKAEYPAEYKDAEAAMLGAEIAYANERFEPAATLAGEVSSTFSDQFKKNVAADRKAKADYEAYQKVQAEKAAAAEKARQEEVLKNKAGSDIAKAQSQYDWAASKNASNNYPELLSRGGAELEAAKKALAGKDYNGASVEALRAYSTLSNVQEFAPLPATYVVRLIPERRDCLWRIAEYSFIYNNPLKWPVLYEANKKTFKDPSNPDLIFPNQVLVVPSIAGETRSGVWDPKKTYNPLPKPKAKK